MHSVSTEVRVGIFALITLSILAFSIFWLNGGRLFEKGSVLEIEFERVDGIRPGAPVKLAGVDIGRVKRIFFSEQQTVIVAIKLKPGIQINEDSQFSIVTAGVIGEKHLEILPGKSANPVKAGTRLKGETPLSTDELFESAYEMLKDTHAILSSLRDYTENKELRASIVKSVQNIEVITRNLRQFTDKLDEIPLETMVARANRILETVENIAVTSEPRVQQIVMDLAKASEQLTTVLTKADRFLEEINGDGQASRDIRRILSLSAQTLEDIEALAATLNQEKEHVGPLLEEARAAAGSIRQAADSLKKLLDSLSSGEATDNQNLTSTIQQATDLVNKAHGFVAALDRIEHRIGFSGSDATAGLDYRLDFPLNNRSSLVFDLKDIGDDNSLSLQLGYSFGKLRTRLGYINEELGGGLDLQLDQNWLLSLDVWDPHKTQGDVLLSYFLNKHWVIGSGAYDVTRDPIWAWQVGYWF